MPKEPNLSPITCPRCNQTFELSSVQAASFCPFCGNGLNSPVPKKQKNDPEEKKDLLSNRYQIIESIGKGGMGEVYSVFDLFCGRRIALKKIRSDLIDHVQVRRRFLKEARITCQLMHPAIIPIYSIQDAGPAAFYTMPFVEGETLKQIIRKTRQQEKNGEELDHIGGSIPALMRIFITICQAVAYAHAKGVIHRDLKPENIIIGKYGEVLILDWGLAKFIHSPSAEEEEKDPSLSPATPLPENQAITRLGKVVGTVAYMAPERALGQPATIQTDIYSLGVILYQLLTLQPPFKRGKLDEFRKNMAKEELIDPVVAAPYRDVPKMLARVVNKCLSVNPQERPSSVAGIIHELENYLEGRSEWFHVADLNIHQKTDWEFQEHILIAEHLAITRTTEEAEWVNLMISRQSFTGNTRIETTLCLGSEGSGIGILFSVPEMSERGSITDGYCLWLGSDQDRSTKLLRSNVEVMQAPDIFIKRFQKTHIRIEKIDKSIHLFLDGILQFSYIAPIPLIGTHIGLMSKDAGFELDPLEISVGSLNLTVNCLAVPDAFLAHRDFSQALSEYRRIAYSFPDRFEGREAIFRSGLTLIEQAKIEQTNNPDEKALLLDQALTEFEKLHNTPGGPLEYMGKALVYQALNDIEEEIKCFEIAYRRYTKHPLLPVLQEQILSRMHDVSRQQRMAAYRFALLSARHLPRSAIDAHTRRLYSSLQKHWEVLPFIEDHSSKTSPTPSMQRYAIPLAFWLAKLYTLGEIIDDLLKFDPVPAADIANALMCLIELGAWNYARQKIADIAPVYSLTLPPFNHLGALIAGRSEPLEVLWNHFFQTPSLKIDFQAKRIIFHLLDAALDIAALDISKANLVHAAIKTFEQCELSFDVRLRLNVRQIWAFLLEKNWEEAGKLIESYPLELLNKESTPLHFLYGCWLQATEGTEIAMIHFMGLLHATYPRSWTLASHALAGNLLERGWMQKAFLWEKKQLCRQLSLYYHCAGDSSLQLQFLKEAQEQSCDIAPE